VFMGEWLAVGRAERIPDPGDWFTVELMGEPIIVLRSKQGEVRAMSSVCQHRAMEVCSGSGNDTTFKCPYHHWSYGQDGRLLGAPAMERTDDFDKSEHGLPTLRVEEWMGFIFVNFDDDAAPLAPTLDRYTPFLENYDLENAVCPGTFTLEAMPWNWKVMFENFNDGYHANRLHQFLQDFCPSDQTAFPVPWHDSSNVIFRTAGYTHIDGGFNATHRVIMDVFPKLTEEERTRSTFALIRRPTSVSSSWCAPQGPKRSTSRSATSFTLQHSKTLCSTRSSNCPMRACRYSCNRIRMPRPRFRRVWPRGSLLGAGTRGRRKATSSSLVGATVPSSLAELKFALRR